MKYFVTLALVLLAGPVMAAPFLVCDPQPGVTDYSITGDAALAGMVLAHSDGSLRKDLNAVPAGSHTINVVACNAWGCSTAVPFSFGKQIPNPPTGLRLQGY